MKIWIDKHGGMHYHKKGCLMMSGKPISSIGTHHYHYEEIEHQIRHIARSPYYYTDITVEGKQYRPCPICF